jgi:hypothetical protein
MSSPSSLPTNTLAQYAFANAIATAEGYGANPNNLPTRSNNPGDIGNTGFAQQGYATAQDGWAALDNQVSEMFNGTSQHYNPNMTIAQVGALYAKNLDGTPNANWPTNVAGTLGVSPNTTLAQLASGQVQFKVIPRINVPGSSQGNNGPAGAADGVYGPNDIDPVTAVPVQGSTAQVTQEDINPPLVIMAGLDQTPWFSDPDIIRNDAPTAAVPSPVTFGIVYNQSGTATLPLQIKLKASLSHNNRSLRHISNVRQTMTGVSATFWGMQPDLISGTGTTGAFMNRLGLTDFLSVSQLSPEVLALVQQGWSLADLQLQPDGLRIAAKDAFVEFLFAFKNNGLVWFRNPNYTGYASGKDNELGNDAWSPDTGSSTFQNRARRNDVMTRGNVIMYFRNSAYYGYFKSLTWTEDAKKPFSWDFTFAFQVERTVTAVPVPDFSS